jgi:hypothetical protein
LFRKLWSLILDTVGGRQVHKYSFIKPTLEYDCEVWDGCFEREVAKLEKVQLESASIVTGLTKFASRDSLYYETGWEPLSCSLKAAFTMLSIWFVQFPSDAKVNPKCLWFITI